MSWFMIIEDTFEITGRGTVVTGTPFGCPNTGNHVVIWTEEVVYKTIVTGVERFRPAVDPDLDKGITEKANKPIGILLRNMKKDEIQEGSIIIHDSSILHPRVANEGATSRT